MGWGRSPCGDSAGSSAMPRHFVSSFILPLVKGGRLRVGRPVGWPDLGRLVQRRSRDADGPSAWQSQEARAAAEVARLRELHAASLVAEAPLLPLDEPSLRLAAAAHNLLLLGHPELAGRSRNQERVAELVCELADLGPPANLTDAVARYSLLARLPETVRVEHQARVGPRWLRFELHAVGGSPSVGMRALARLSATPVQTRRRAWWKEIGFPACADHAVAVLFRACPLLEAMDPLRLHPPLSWRRILSVLRFPALGRAVAGRVLELGCEPAGSALAGALLRFASVGDEGSGPATAEEIVFAIRFVAHVCWLDRLFGLAREPNIGSDLAALLAAAADAEPELLWPPDLAPDEEPGVGFARMLRRLSAETPGCVPDRYRAMRSLCALAG
jgi:hypothetical protein